MELSVEGRGRGRPKKKWLNTIEEDIRLAGMWKIRSNGGLRLRWSTPNRWDKGKDDDKKIEYFQNIKTNHLNYFVMYSNLIDH